MSVYVYMIYAYFLQFRLLQNFECFLFIAQFQLADLNPPPFKRKHAHVKSIRDCFMNRQSKGPSQGLVAQPPVAPLSSCHYKTSGNRTFD